MMTRTMKLNEDANRLVCETAGFIKWLPREERTVYMERFVELVYLLGASVRKSSVWAGHYQDLEWLRNDARQKLEHLESQGVLCRPRRIK